MNTCSSTIHYKTIIACFKVFVGYNKCSDELENTYSSSCASSAQPAPLTPQTSPNVKKVKRECIESFDTLTLWTPETLDFTVTLIA